MFITDIKTQKKDKNRVSIFIDNEFRFGLSLEECYFLEIEIGGYIDNEKIEFIEASLVRNKASDYALKYLSYSMRTEYQIFLHLKKYDFSEKVIEVTIQKMKDYGYVNDLEYANSYVGNSRKQSRFALRYKLKQRGIGDDLIDLALEKNPINENEIATELLLRKYENYDEFDEKLKSKAYRFLHGKGFSSDSILFALEALENEYE